MRIGLDVLTGGDSFLACREHSAESVCFESRFEPAVDEQQVEKGEAEDGYRDGSDHIIDGLIKDESANRNYCEDRDPDQERRYESESDGADM